MKILVKKVEGLQLPVQANPGEDAAYDIIAATDGQIVGTRYHRAIDQLTMFGRVTYIEYGTNLYIAPLPDTKQVTDNILGMLSQSIVDYHTQIYPRSSVSGKNLVLANCVPLIDTGYRGQIMLRFKYLFQPEDLLIYPENGVNRIFGTVNKEFIYNKGDKIAQIKASPNIPINFETVEVLPDSSRKTGGFGSSGK